MNKFIYLAIPYTWNHDKSFEIANIMSAILMESGYTVFSPISHSHPISKHLTNFGDSNADFWLAQDLCILEKCDELHVVIINESFGQELIDKSYGC